MGCSVCVCESSKAAVIAKNSLCGSMHPAHIPRSPRTIPQAPVLTAQQVHSALNSVGQAWLSPEHIWDELREVSAADLAKKEELELRPRKSLGSIVPMALNNTAQLSVGMREHVHPRGTNWQI